MENGDLFSFSNFMLQIKIDIKSEEINDRNIVIATILSLEVLFGEIKKGKYLLIQEKKKL